MKKMPGQGIYIYKYINIWPKSVPGGFPAYANVIYLNIYRLDPKKMRIKSTKKYVINIFASEELLQ